LTPQRLVRQWIRESAPMANPPQQLAEAVLLSHVVRQCEDLGVAERARIMGVSIPTYHKRLQETVGNRSGRGKGDGNHTGGE
jgi:DNA-directed RNA polymerase specialized sigma24 family protein